MGSDVCAVEEEDGAVGEENVVEHGAALGKAVEFPGGGFVVVVVGRGGGRRERSDAAARGVCGGSEILIGASAADENFRGPVVGGGEGEEDRGSRVGISAIFTW